MKRKKRSLLIVVLGAQIIRPGAQWSTSAQRAILERKVLFINNRLTEAINASAVKPSSLWCLSIKNSAHDLRAGLSVRPLGAGLENEPISLVSAIWKDGVQFLHRRMEVSCSFSRLGSPFLVVKVWCWKPCFVQLFTCTSTWSCVPVEVKSGS